MARFEYSTQHGGVIRFTRGLESAGNLSITQLIVAALAFIGTPVVRAMAGVRASLNARSVRRDQRRQDDRLWNIALADARVMADLSRAMSQDATREVRGHD